MVAWQYQFYVIRIPKRSNYGDITGITWGHSRGYTSVVATAQRFGELHLEVNIQWEKRSLQAFADGSLDTLAQQYDLLVIDHPWAGFVVEKSLLLPLQQYLPAGYLADQKANSVGGSYESYEFNGCQSALAIDAATPIAVYRLDHLAAGRFSLPTTWDHLLALAQAGRVIYARIPINLLMDFLMLCATRGGTWFDGETITDRETGIEALETLRELASYCPEAILTPIRYKSMKRYRKRIVGVTARSPMAIPITRGADMPATCLRLPMW
ncbi:hypothetical protein SODG_005550 [Sodalis praecaptivus]